MKVEVLSNRSRVEVTADDGVLVEGITWLPRVSLDRLLLLDWCSSEKVREAGGRGGEEERLVLVDTNNNALKLRLPTRHMVSLSRSALVPLACCPVPLVHTYVLPSPQLMKPLASRIRSLGALRAAQDDC